MMDNVVALTHPSVHLGQPDGLTDAQSKVWKLTVESRSADYFGPDSVPMLVEYCRAVVCCDQLAAKIEAAEDIAGARVLYDMRDKESRRMTSLATKLRLTNQSRYTPKAAATAAKHGAGGKVWQFGKTGD